MLSDFTRNKLLTAKLLNQGYRYHKLRKAFSKFYRRHSDLVSKFNVGLRSLLQQGLSEAEFYGDLVYKLRKIYACNDFSTRFRKIILRYKKIGYNINVIRQTACMVVNPITVNNFASLFNCTPAGLGLSFCDGSSVKAVCWYLMLYLWSGPPESYCWFSFALVSCCRVLIVVSSP